MPPGGRRQTRVAVANEPLTPEVCDRPVWRANLGRLAAHDLVFDLMVFPHQLSEAARLAGDFPAQTFVLNHCGSPIDRDPDGMLAWRDGLATLARHPNVRIKISDLVAYDPHWTLDSLAPVVLTCIDCFGPERGDVRERFSSRGSARELR